MLASSCRACTLRQGSLRPADILRDNFLAFADCGQSSQAGTSCRWLAGQLIHYQHCLFQHRRQYRFLLFLDTDEFPIIRAHTLGMPALLEQAFQLYPKAAGEGPAGAGKLS